MKGTGMDVADRNGRPFRMTTLELGKDRSIAKMFDTIPPLGEVKVMTILFQRR